MRTAGATYQIQVQEICIAVKASLDVKVKKVRWKVRECK